MSGKHIKNSKIILFKSIEQELGFLFDRYRPKVSLDLDELKSVDTEEDREKLIEKIEYQVEKTINESLTKKIIPIFAEKLSTYENKLMFFKFNKLRNSLTNIEAEFIKMINEDIHPKYSKGSSGSKLRKDDSDGDDSDGDECHDCAECHDDECGDCNSDVISGGLSDFLSRFKFNTDNDDDDDDGEDNNDDEDDDSELINPMQMAMGMGMGMGMGINMSGESIDLESMSMGHMGMGHIGTSQMDITEIGNDNPEEEIDFTNLISNREEELNLKNKTEIIEIAKSLSISIKEGGKSKTKSKLIHEIIVHE